MTDINPNLFTLHCRRCGAPISKRLHAIDEGITLRDETEVAMVPEGCFAPSEMLLDSGCQSPYIKRGELLVNIGDLPDAVPGGNRNGCCGPDGCDGPNLFCANGHAIGTEVGDCWTACYCHVPLEWVSLAPAPKVASHVSI